MSTQKPRMLELVIKPSIQVIGGNPHPLMQMLQDKKELPVMKAAGFFKIENGKRDNHVACTMVVEDGKLTIEVEEPNLKNIAEETAKISFVTLCVHTEDF